MTASNRDWLPVVSSFFRYVMVNSLQFGLYMYRYVLEPYRIATSDRRPRSCPGEGHVEKSDQADSLRRRCRREEGLFRSLKCGCWRSQQISKCRFRDVGDSSEGLRRKGDDVCDIIIVLRFIKWLWKGWQNGMVEFVDIVGSGFMNSRTVYFTKLDKTYMKAQCFKYNIESEVLYVTTFALFISFL